MKSYDHKKIEKKWQDRWEAESAYRAEDAAAGAKDYLLIEFPYPSGDGLHVGHVRSWTALDVVARKRRAQGRNVLYPIGWDAFGLPTENYALKTGRNPRIVTKENTDNFRRQIKSLGLSFDWSREINTTDPDYYKWTQWIFLQFYKKGLAYKAKTLINWCPKDKIGLANEEVVDGACERCGTPVVKREKEQWMLAITKYAERLYDDLDTVDYIERAKTQQRNWIGPSEGAEIDFYLDFGDEAVNGHLGPDGKKAHLTVFTTRPDTLYGATYMVLAPEHPWITLALSHRSVLQNNKEVQAYIEQAKNKSEIERTAEGREKTGVELKGVKAIHPATGERIPLYVADYVIGNYGTGAIMAVPAHDDRDWEFAQALGITHREVIRPESGEPVHLPFPDYGILFNSGEFDGLRSEEARERITEKVGGAWVKTYKLRDWVFSRQRYWGEPIPMIHCEACGWQPVPEDQLPVKLPEVEKYQPTDTGESPLANIQEWVDTTCPNCSGPAKRETDVMPNWAGSSWYYLRYTDPRNALFFAGKEKLGYWTPVDWYNGGMEHTVLHLLYSRFWHKFLFDQGLVPSPEPYMKRTSHGLILAEDSSKMSKSRGNTVSPDTIVEHVGADALRLYEMFLGPFDQPVAWNQNGIVGMRRFLERVNGLEPGEGTLEDTVETLLHQTIKKVTEDVEALKMNTAVSSLMILLNALEELERVPREAYKIFLRLLAPFAPHLCHELWENAGEKTELRLVPWPVADLSKAKGKVARIAIQIDGKTKGEADIETGATEEAHEQAARRAIAEKLAGRDIARVIVIPNRLVNFVTRH